VGRPLLAARLPGTEAALAGHGRPADGDLLVLYTDGLVERRTFPIDAGLERLRTTAGGLASHPVDRITERLLSVLARDGAYEDDVCLLVGRAHPATRTLVHRFPADPAELAGCRAVLRGWLQELGVSTMDEQHIVLAVGEAAANSVEHAYRGGTGEVEVVGSVDADHTLVIAVRDGGSWRPESADPHRGRGRHVMAAVVDRVELDRDGPGTEVRLCRQVQPQAVRELVG
jgi:anti-sigma regulatory factor (Ser/Thr protein kinase)